MTNKYANKCHCVTSLLLHADRPLEGGLDGGHVDEAGVVELEVRPHALPLDAGLGGVLGHDLRDPGDLQVVEQVGSDVADLVVVQVLHLLVTQLQLHSEVAVTGLLLVECDDLAMNWKII